MSSLWTVRCVCVCDLSCVGICKVFIRLYIYNPHPVICVIRTPYTLVTRTKSLLSLSGLLLRCSSRQTTLGVLVLADGIVLHGSSHERRYAPRSSQLVNNIVSARSWVEVYQCVNCNSTTMKVQLQVQLQVLPVPLWYYTATGEAPCATLAIPTSCYKVRSL